MLEARVVLLLAAPILMLAAAGCAPSRPSHVSIDGFDALVGHQRQAEVDVWAVAVCRVPSDVSNPLYAPLADRLDLSSAEIVDRLSPVSDYFVRWSRGRYTIEWRAAAPVDLGPDGDPMSCVDRAAAESSDEVTGVLVIADAQHGDDQIGGWGRRGTPCDQPCPVSQSGRSVYVGASDFMPQWNGNSPLDLIEHEIGHALGWPHSATDGGFSNGGHVYDSPFDLMSNSAAPREADEDRRGAPGVLAANLYAAGWLTSGETVVVDPERYGVSEWHDAAQLASTDSSGDGSQPRLVVVPLSDERFVTLELIAARGDNAHLTMTGLVVHLVESADTNEGRHNVLLTTDPIGENRSWVWSDGGLEFRLGRVYETSGRVVADVRLRRLGPDRVPRTGD